MRTTLACILALTFGSGCVVVNSDHLNSLRDGGSNTNPDGQVTPVDAGGPQFDDSCGSTMPRRTLRGTTRGITIDTREGYRSTVSQACGATTPGNDAFIAVEVAAGEYWHFHLSTPDTTRRPILFLTPASSCDTRTCEFVSEACSGSGDEHFAFRANSPGRWFIGIDDGETGGGEYTLEAFRPVCGMNGLEHGEGCDDGNNVDGDGCDRRCRRELSELQSVEVEPNDNNAEANALRLTAGNELQITGIIGGRGACTYADVFAISVLTSGQDLEVDALMPDGSPCASRALTPYQLALRGADGIDVSTNMQDSNGCSVVRAVNLDAGEYFVRVTIPEERENPADYRLRFRLNP